MQLFNDPPGQLRIVGLPRNAASPTTNGTIETFANMVKYAQQENHVG
jgi:hypothetical protein